MNEVEELEFRELIYQITDREGLDSRLSEGPITLYIGFDPTADSLHIGNLLQILLLHRFQLAGHRPIAVVGTGTGLVGDPSGRKSERKLNPEEVVEEWASKIRSQVERFLDFNSLSNPARIVSNYDWLGELELISFLRETGKHFPIGQMLAKDSVKSRLEEGISYTEFSYMILQAYDFLQLYELYDCQMQAGGSDQWGNINSFMLPVVAWETYPAVLDTYWAVTPRDTTGGVCGKRSRAPRNRSRSSQKRNVFSAASP